MWRAYGAAGVLAALCACGGAESASPGDTASQVAATEEEQAARLACLIDLRAQAIAEGFTAEEWEAAVVEECGGFVEDAGGHEEEPVRPEPPADAGEGGGGEVVVPEDPAECGAFIRALTDPSVGEETILRRIAAHCGGGAPVEEPPPAEEPQVPEDPAECEAYVRANSDPSIPEEYLLIRIAAHCG